MDFRNRKLFLAPLAGITETVFRRLCKQCGADVVVSEMVSADGVAHNARNTAGLVSFHDVERPIGIQLFGAKPQTMADAAAWVQEHARPDFIDLNAGCPVPKVVSRNGGVALMRDPRLFGAIVAAMVKAVSIPVTVKIRSGWNVGEWVDIEFARIAQDAGAAAITLHPRSKTMLFTGHSYWERIGEVKNAVSIPVIGNGDITSGQDALNMLSSTGCDSVMVGRAALGNPWIFSEIRDALQGKAPLTVTRAQRREMVLTHLYGYICAHGETRASAEMKKQVAWYITGVPGAAAARHGVFSATSTAELIDAVEKALGGGEERRISNTSTSLSASID